MAQRAAPAATRKRPLPPAAQDRKRLVVPATQEDFARFGDDASRQVLLMRLPTQVAKAWKPLFEDGGQEYTQHSGFRDIEPKVELGMLMGDLNNNGTLALQDGSGSYLQFSLSLRQAMGMRMRVISAEVADTAPNIKFEGEVSHNVHLRPSNPDDLYKTLIEQRAEIARQKTEIRKLSLKEERQIRETQGTHVIEVAGATGFDDVLDDGEEEAAKEKKGAKSKSKRPSTDAAAPKPKTSKKKDKRSLTADEIKEILYKCFSSTDPTTGQPMRYWKMKDLRKATGLQQHIMRPVLDEICDYNQGGEHHKTYSLKFVGSGAASGSS